MTPYRSRKSLWQTLLVASLGAWAVTANAASPPQMCALPSFEGLPRAAQSGDKTITVDADSVTAFRHGVSLFQGDVTVVQGDKRMAADRLTYDSIERDITAEGNVLFGTPSLQVKGDRGQYSLDSKKGTFLDAAFRLPERHGRGHADKIERIGPGLSKLYDATFTTCPLGRKDWALKTSEADLNRNTDIGTAYNATLWFYGVPIFYTPYISFPLSDQRKSGFLAPRLGYSSGDGIDVTIPYYFNIAPNMDATLSPRILGRRGVLTTGQFRYLLPGTEGKLDISLLPYDRLAHRHRSHIHFGNSTRINDNWRFGVDLNHVSDDDYFADFGQSLTETARLNQVSNVQFDYNDAAWSFLTRFRSYQTLRSNRPPYRQLPRMQLDWRAPPKNFRLDYGFESELVRFTYPGRVGAARLNVRPQANYTFGSNAWYIRPAAKLDLAEYQLYNTRSNRPTQLSRTAPILSLDTGLTFERDAFGGLIETLEPRLFYLYVPYRDQGDIPLFDTKSATFNYLQLFADNRFNGADRLGDANQLSYALTTRFVRPETGRELLAASIGQIHYFSDRRVMLHGGKPATRSRSDIIGQLRVNINDRWTSTAALQWNQKTRQNDVASLQLQYHGGPSQVVNLAYRFRRDRLEETDVSIAWPVTRHWKVIGRWNYSLMDERTRETFVGIQFENCCWSLTLVDRNYLRPGGEMAQSYYLQLQFKGLGRLGRDVGEFLERGILGYGE